MPFTSSTTIRSRLLQILMTAVVSVVTILVGAWHFIVMPALQMSVARHQQQIALRAADQIGHFVENRTQSLIAAAEIGHSWDGNREHQKEALYRLLQLDPHIEEVGLLNPNGREIVRLSRSRVYRDSDLVSLAQDERFQQAMQQGKTSIGPVYTARTAEPFVTVAVPFKFTAGEIKDVIIAEVTLKSLWDSISDIKVGRSGHAFVVDEKGNLIAHQDYSKVLRGINLSHLPEVREFLSDARDLDFGQQAIGESGQKVLGTFAVVKGLNWAVVVEEPVETALAEIRNARRVGISLLVIVTGATFLIGYFFSGRITRPVRELEEGARLIAEGDLGQKLEIRTGDEIESLAHQFNRMAQALKQSYRDLSSFYATLAPLTSSDADKLLQQVVERLKAATHADAALIRIFDKGTKSFLCPAHVGFPSSYLEATRNIEKRSAIGTTFMTGDPIIASDVAQDPRLSGRKQLEAGFRSCAFLPLRISGELRGVVHLASREIGYFSGERSDHLMTLACQMGVAMENRELFEESKERAQEQAALSAIAMAASQSLQIHEMLQNALDKTLEVTKRTVGIVRLKDDANDRLRVVAHKGISDSYVNALDREDRIGRKALEVLLTGEIRILDNPSPAEFMDDSRAEGLQSRLWVPIQARGRILGILTVASRVVQLFDAREIELLKAIGSIFGTAVSNARLFEEAEQRAKEQEALNVIAKATSQSLHLDELLEIALDKVLEVTGRERVSIRLKDSATGKVQLAAHRGFSKEEIDDLLRRVPHQASDQVFASGQPLVVNNRPDFGDPHSLLPQSHSVAWIPIKVGARVVGVLGVSAGRAVPFVQREVDLLQAVGNVIGVALENAGLFEEAKKTSQEQQVLREFLSKLLLLDLDELLQRMTEQAALLFRAEYVRVRLFDRDGRIKTRAVVGDKEVLEIMSVTEEREELAGRGRQILSSRKPLAIKDIAQEVGARPSRGVKAGLHGSLGAPLLGRDQQPLGIIQIMTRSAGDFSQRDLDLIEQFAQGAAIAIENARLFEEAQTNLRRVRALREIDQAISSTLDLRTVLDVLLEKIDLVLPYSAATVRLFNEESGLLEPVACRNLDEEEWKVSIWRGGRGISNVVFETKAPLIILNAQTDSRVRDVEFYRKHKLISYVGIPLIVKDEILGVLGFYTKEEHEFTSEEVEFLSTLGGQAAIAIHNSQLYEEARTREAQLQETNRMLSALHSVAAAASQSLNLDRILQAAVEKITEIFRFDATRIHIYNERTDELFLKVWFETDPDRFTSARSFKKGEGIVGTVAESGKPMIFEDIQNDPLYEQISRIKLLPQFGYHFLAVFPIKGRLKNVGTLTFIGRAPRKLSSGEVQLLEAMADQIAVAIENSELYEDVRQKVQELQEKTADLERANQVKNEFLSVMSHELRTPLNVVMGYTGMIKDGMLGDTNSEQEKALEKVMGRTKDLLNMITSILYATSIEAHEVRVEPHRFALGDFLDGLRRDFDISRDKPLSLIWNYSSDLPTVETDSEKLQCVLQNLIYNAIKFSESGHVTISVRIQGSVEPRAIGSDQQPEKNRKEELVEFKVTDTGIGIPTEKLPIIFGMFRQVDSSETRLHGGVGLGLYIAKNFTELLGGKIEVETEVGKGSSFAVTIPCVIHPAAVGQMGEDGSRALEGHEFPHPSHQTQASGLKGFESQ